MRRGVALAIVVTLTASISGHGNTPAARECPEPWQLRGDEVREFRGAVSVKTTSNLLWVLVSHSPAPQVQEELVPQFRVQFFTPLAAPIDFNGPARLLYADTALAVVVGEREGWLFRVVDRPFPAGLAGLGLEQVPAHGLARYSGLAARAARGLWRMNEEEMEEGECPRTCVGGGPGATSCGYSCMGTSCNVTCGGGTWACCGCDVIAFCRCCQ